MTVVAPCPDHASRPYGFANSESRRGLGIKVGTYTHSLISPRHCECLWPVVMFRFGKLGTLFHMFQIDLDVYQWGYVSQLKYLRLSLCTALFDVDSWWDFDKGFNNEICRVSTRSSAPSDLQIKAPTSDQRCDGWRCNCVCKCMTNIWLNFEGFFFWCGTIYWQCNFNHWSFDLSCVRERRLDCLHHFFSPPPTDKRSRISGQEGFITLLLRY